MKRLTTIKMSAFLEKMNTKQLAFKQKTLSQYGIVLESAMEKHPSSPPIIEPGTAEDHLNQNHLLTC